MLNFLEREGILKADEKAIVEYGLERGKTLLAGLLITLFIGSYFGLFWQSLCFWLFLFPLRTNAGGYHAETEIKCYALSLIVIVISFYCLKNLIWNIPVSLIITCFEAIIILLLAPVENNNKKLDSLEIMVYKKRTKIAIFIEGVIYIISILLKKNQVSNIIAMVFLVVSISLVMGFINLHKINLCIK